MSVQAEECTHSQYFVHMTGTQQCMCRTGTSVARADQQGDVRGAAKKKCPRTQGSSGDNGK